MNGQLRGLSLVFSYFQTIGLELSLLIIKRIRLAILRRATIANNSLRTLHREINP